MKYLNKIVFINSAGTRYAEVSIDGNVHFIGTQGVGKSTLLRAILFFYNADKLKLGISREKKSYDEYYFPYQNSYVIYEVAADTGAYCVLSFKSQGRVVFRFIDTNYDKKFFIDNEGKAYEIWDKIREIMSKENIHNTKIINSYEDFRNIIYGNNKGLSTEFRKYAILESKQYQNIPRTIQNVFLNSKLDAEFIKETIIKSLNEEEIIIDLMMYSQNHLKDFESNLNDIKKWTEKSRSGESPIKKQAENVIKLYSFLKYMEANKSDLARQLGWASDNLTKEQPLFIKKQETINENKQKIEGRIANADENFIEKVKKINGELTVIKRDLGRIKEKQDYYTSINIEGVIIRVEKKNEIETEEQNLLNEKRILTTEFAEIANRYEAMKTQLENQLKEYENNKQSEKNNHRESVLKFKEDISKQYELQIDEINKQNNDTVETAKNIIEEKKKEISDLRIKKSEIKHKRYYEEEIGKCRLEIDAINKSIQQSEIEIEQLGEKIKNIQKEWSLEEESLKEKNKIEIEIQNEKQNGLKENINSIVAKIENSRDSLYGWLNENIPDWDRTIGKVIDEDNILFKAGLNPVKVEESTLNFYGIRIDLEEVDKKVKTIADYEKEKNEINKLILEIQQRINNLHKDLEDNTDKLKKKFQPKIRELKEKIEKNKYFKEQSNGKLDNAKVLLTDLNTKAVNEKQAELGKIEDIINKINDEEIKAEENLKKLENSIKKQVDSKKKERESKVKAEEDKLNIEINKIDNEIKSKKNEIKVKQAEIKNKEKGELDSKGANTKRINEIEELIKKLKDELKFIEENRDKVAEYNKDKRELIDRVEEFKTNKALHEKQLETEKSKLKMLKEKLLEELKEINSESDEINKQIKVLEDDIKAYDEFKISEAYETVQKDISEFSDENKTEKLCTQLIKEINEIYYNLIKRYTELQEAINKFAGNFNENNIFSFKIKFIDKEEYIEFADKLKEFIEEDKIIEYEKRVNERFAHIIRQIGKETGELVSKEGEISKVIDEINKDFRARNFVGAIKSMELRTVESANKIVQLLIEIKKFNDENSNELGKPNLFTSEDQPTKNEKAIDLLKQLIKEMAIYKEKEIRLSDSFELQFRIVENDNDTDWVEKLSNVGSDGTDILVKAMINIMLLNVFKERAAKKYKDEFRLHCMMDEIGKLHPTNVKGILKFANERNINLINSSPTTYNATDYKYTYLLTKDTKNITTVKRLIKKVINIEEETTAEFI